MKNFTSTGRSRLARATRLTAVTLALLGASQAALAHVSYIDLGTSPGGSGGATFTNSGWWAGTTAALGDSHDLAEGGFFSFQLSQASMVSITFTDVSVGGALNPAFSLYKGLLPDEAHDDNVYDPLNPKLGAPPFTKIASAVDNGVATDVFGRVSPFRDTANVTFAGQFNALGSWSMAYESGDWSVLEYVTHVGPAGGTGVALINYQLTAGFYTIAAGGGTNLTLPGAVALSGLDGTVSFTAAPVPEPEAVWMMLGGLLLMGAIRAKRSAPTT